MWSCSLFFSLPLIFTLVAASISHFLTAAIKFSCYYIEVLLPTVKTKALISKSSVFLLRRCLILLTR